MRTAPCPCLPATDGGRAFEGWAGDARGCSAASSLGQGMPTQYVCAFMLSKVWRHKTARRHKLPGSAHLTCTLYLHRCSNWRIATRPHLRQVSG